MDKQSFELLEGYMRECMKDAAHDNGHIYRVLYNAMDIARTEVGVDYDVLIAACLLHDIGREEQFKNSALDHAEVGGEKAYRFLTENGFDAEFAEKVKGCIVTHRFRKSKPPRSLEAKILFDADKLDVTGAMGVARTLVYKGGVGDPLYRLDDNGLPSDGNGDRDPSFFQEYHYKLKNLYDKFYTQRGRETALQHRDAARRFYEDMYSEVHESYKNGMRLLSEQLENKM